MCLIFLSYLRILFFSLREIGIYSKTLAGLIKTDLKLFSVVYVVVFFAFSGGTYLALRGTAKYNATTGFGAVKVK